MPAHALFWAAATTIFLVYDRDGAARRIPFSFALGLTCLMVLLAARSVAAGKLGRWSYVLLAGGLLAVLALHGAYAWSVGRLHAQAVESVLQTDLSEAMGYLTDRLLALWFVMGIAAFALFRLTLPVAPGRTLGTPWLRTSLLGVGALLLYYGRGVVIEPIEIARDYRNGIAELQRADRAWRARPQRPLESGFNGAIIVVLGESTSRHHMGLYGYPRNTTPRLAALQPQLAVFSDAISNHTNTVGSVIDALTLDSGAPNAVGVLQLAAAAGFSTTWLSNQNEFGVWDNPIRILATQADNVRYHDATLGMLTARNTFDEAMLPSLDRALAAPEAGRKLIVMHLMSTHLPYCWTKPPRFNPLREEFGKRLYGQQDGWRPWLTRVVKRRTRDLDCYDNGVRYTDRIVGAVVERARALREPAAVVYLSDHGDAALLATGHDAAEFSAYQIEIPLLLWTSQEYRARYGDTWRAALANRGKPFALDRMAPTLIDLMQLHTPRLDPRNSLLNEGYRPRPRYAVNRRFSYDVRSAANDYRINSRLFVRDLGAARQHVWAHRINSLGALLEAKRTFAGIEIDVHFDRASNTFQVRHEYPHIGLTLHDMLHWSRDRPDMQIWLDWKNASPENVGAALGTLQSLDRKYALRSRILLETGSTAISPELAAISLAGFRHGYYLPTDRVLAAMRQGPVAQDALATRLEKIVRRGRFDAVTYDAELQPFVDSRLDTFLRAEGIRRYSWDLSLNSGRIAADPAATAEAVFKRRLDALLVVFPSDFRM